MVIAAKATAIGLTGPFGSGCTTAAELLKLRKKYVPASLSEIVKRRWQKRNPNQVPTRSDLQALGNQLRKDSKNSGYLAQEAIRQLEKDSEAYTHLVFDSIRNLGEIETLKERFGRRFYLFALDCPTSERWERVGPEEYEARGRTLADFGFDDGRDRDEEYAYGQQVQLCVYQADVLVINDSEVALASLRTKLAKYLDLVTGEKPRYPEPREILINLAYAASHGSKCFKRRVGAILVTAPPWEMGEIVGQGFNENPVGTRACVEEPAYGADEKQGMPGQCFRDIVRYKSFVELARTKRRCPACGATLTRPAKRVPPWRCTKCKAQLEEFFWPERAMSLCTAVHAEVAAIMAAAGRARGATLYVTTFPCFQCAQKIAHAGVKYVVYNEPYPDIQAAERLEIAGIGVARFEGIRSSRFEEIFSRARPYIGEQLSVLSKSEL